MAFSEVTVKAFVLLSEEEYLKENVKNPECYFVSLQKRNILSEEQCQELRGISDFKARIAKLVELVSSHPYGFDVFCTLTRRNREDNHVSSFLKRKLSENSFLMVESLSVNSGLSVDHQRRLKLLKFLEFTNATHDMARDILESKNWNIDGALEAAREMGMWKNRDTITCSEYESPRSSSGSSIGDSGEFERYSSLASSGGTENSSARSSSSDLPLNNNGGLCGGYQSDVGLLPVIPNNVTPSPISPVTNDVHPEHGVMPHPPEPSWHEDFSKAEGQGVGGGSSACFTPPSAATAAVSSFSSSTSSGCASEGDVPVPAVPGARIDRPNTLPTKAQRTGARPGGEEKKEQSKPPKVVDDTGKKDLFKRSSSGRQLEVGQSEGMHSSSPNLTSQSPRKADVETDGTNVRRSPMTLLAHYWVCYHCHQKNDKDEVVCQKCDMLSCHTQPSWDQDGYDVSKNYVCRNCSLAVRLPCEPCPPTLISCLQKMVLCNKCYRAYCDQQRNPRLVKTKSFLESKPTLVKLRSMQEESGNSIQIIDEVASRWDDLAPQLDISSAYIRILHKDCVAQCQKASLLMFTKWVDKRDVTWKMLLDALKSINEDCLADRIEQACGYVLPSEKF